MVFKDKRSSRRIWQRGLGNVQRKLRFDLLEDRRLLAGLDVFVFNDLDGSRDHFAGVENGVVRHVVFVDVNRNDQHDASEPIAITNDHGIASFGDLPNGDYAIRLLGNNHSLIQTTNTAPSDASVQIPFNGIARVLKWSGENALWGVVGSDIVKVDTTTGRELDRVRFGSGVVKDVVLTSNVDLAGFALLQQGSDAQQLVRFRATGNQVGSAETISLDSDSLHSLAWVNDQLLGSDTELGDVRLLVANDTIVDQPLHVGPATSGTYSPSIQPLGADRFVVLDSIQGGQRLSIYELPTSSTDLGDYSARLIAERSFPSVKHWTSAPGGNWIAVDTGSETWVLDVISGLPTIASLAESRGPLFLDSVRGILYTGSVTAPNQIKAWNENNWSSHASMAWDGDFQADSALVFSDSGRQVASILSQGLVRRNLAVAQASQIRWENGSSQQIAIGVQFLGNNTAPAIAAGSGWQLDEDTRATVRIGDSSGSGANDVDGDNLHWVMLNGPQRGTLAWSASGIGEYAPNANIYGSDAILLAAFDGRDWSSPVSIPIRIQPLNDTPTGIELGSPILAENSPLHSRLTTVNVVDPDSEDSYDITVDDTRFSVVDNVLQLVRGNLNFEREAFIPIVVSAVNRLFPSDRIARTLTLSVSDQNDPPTGVSFNGNLTVPELTENVVLGDIDVVDEDSISDYVWTVSDGRFEIKDGKLRLAKSTQLDFETQSTIALNLRAVDRSTSWAIERSVNVSVSDQDDAPIGLVLSGAGQVPERRQGVAVGNASVIDPDRGEVYRIAVNDPRFEVVSGVVKLKTGQSVDWIEPGYLDLMFTATSLRSGTQISKSGRLNIIKDKTPYHNDADPADVDGDGTVSPLDPLILINYINKYGPGTVKPEGEGPTPDLDVDGDGVVSPIDVLIVVNRINNRAASGGSGSGNGGGSKPEGEAPEPLFNPPASVQSDSSETLEIGPKQATELLPSSPDVADHSLAAYLEEIELESLRARRRFPR